MVNYTFELNSSIVQNFSSLPVYYTENYKKLECTEGYKLIYFLSSDNSIITVARLYTLKFLRCIQFLSPPIKSNNHLSISEEKIFLNSLVNVVKKNKLADRIMQPLNSCIFSSYPSNSTFCNFGTYILNVTHKSVEELFNSIHSKHRNVIKNANKQKVVIRFSNELFEDFYTLYCETMKRNNVYIENKNHFYNYLKYLPKNIIIGVCYYNNYPQGAAFVLYNKHSAYYLHGASKEVIEINGSINLLQWELIKLLHEREVNNYDFVGARLSNITGTKYEGIQKFKSRFGTTLLKGNLWKMDINPIKCKIFDTMLFIKCKIKGKALPKDIIDQEIESK